TALHHVSTTTGFLDLKMIAVSRLMLDNIDHIKAYWIMLTPRIAQISQRFGADDLDGTLVEEKIYHDAGATTSQSLRRGELVRLIKQAGREPVERDTMYRPVDRGENVSPVGVCCAAPSGGPGVDPLLAPCRTNSLKPPMNTTTNSEP